LTVIGVVNLGYDSDLSDDHPKPVAAFTPVIFSDDIYDSVTFIKFIGQAIILPFTEEQCFSSRAPPEEMKKTVLRDHQYTLPGLTFFIVAILISFQAIFISFNQNYLGVLLWKNRKMLKCSMTHTQINCKATQIRRLSFKKADIKDNLKSAFYLSKKTFLCCGDIVETTAARGGDGILSGHHALSKQAQS